MAEKNFAKKAAESIKKAGQTVKGHAEDLAGKTFEFTDDVKNQIVKKIDANGNGEIDIEDIIIISLRAPGIRIHRDDFLRKELSKYCSESIIDKAIATSPKEAEIELKLIDHICDEVIKKERFTVSGISAALGLPGGAAAVASLPADILQYYGIMIRTSQEMLYLYGFPEIYTEDGDGELDSETLNLITLCIGSMYGVGMANKGIKIAANALAKGVPKQLMKKALTKGVIYPIVKSIAKWFGESMTKEVFVKGVGKAIPVAGAIVGGGISFISFTPACKKLKKSLRDTPLSNPDINKFDGTDEEILKQEFEDGIIDIDFDDYTEINEEQDTDEN